MLIGIDKQHKIRQVNDITDSSLTVIELEGDFTGWGDVEMLSYCCKKSENSITMYPYIDTDIIEKLVQEEDKRNNFVSFLTYELIQKQLELEAIHRTQADLIYQLMIGGVL